MMTLDKHFRQIDNYIDMPGTLLYWLDYIYCCLFVENT